jgi:RecA/RadA recombinase
MKIGVVFGNPETTTDGTSLYVADTGNHNIRKVTVPDSVVTTLAGQTISSGSNANYTNSTTFSSARFDNPRGITSDGLNLYVFDTVNNAIRKIQ